MTSQPGARPSAAQAPAPLAERLARPARPLLLDGATGTELERAGLTTGLPLWSTHALLDAPDVVRDVHRRYVEAGAEVITANTFRTQRRTLARAGLGERDEELTRLAVSLVREAIAEAGAEAAAGPVYVAGSLPPLEDCYRPERVPAQAELEREHVRQAGLLAAAGVDLVLVETMGSGREALVATQAAVATGLPVVAGFVAWEPGRILSGEALDEVGHRVLEAGALAVGVNCVPPSSLEASRVCLLRLGAPLLVSPNLGEPDDEVGFARREDCTPDAFAALFDPWLEDLEHPPCRPALIGGCCGTTPAHLAALEARLRGGGER